MAGLLICWFIMYIVFRDVFQFFGIHLTSPIEKKVHDTRGYIQNMLNLIIILTKSHFIFGIF